MYTTVPAKVVGDVVTATPMWNTHIADNFNKAVMRPIAETTLGVASATIDFTSIAADWTSLILVMEGRGDTAARSVLVNGIFNSDSGANYDSFIAGILGTGAAQATGVSRAGTSFRAGSLVAATGLATAQSGFEITIPNYAGTTLRKSYQGVGWLPGDATSDGEIQAIFPVGGWRSTAAINRITLTAAAGNFIAGTKATLYGIGGI